MDYLNEAKCNSENEYGIAIAYKYEPTKLDEKYKSFSGRGSPALDDKLKNFIKKPLVKSVTGTPMNALVLKNDKKLLSEVLLQTVKIRGVVCSENKPAPGVDDKNALEASCITTLDKLK